MSPISTKLAIASTVAAVAAAMVAYSYQKKAGAKASSETCVLKNSAFVFIKPHANTAATQALVKNKLEGAGITIMSESDISGPEIDEKKLIDQHYYAIASKATILPASEIPVPADKFKAEFGLEWADALKEGKAVNAMDACKKFGCDAAALNEAWSKSPKVVKFGGGFYCGLVTVGDHDPLYVFNAFFMSMRSKFVGADDSIHCYAVEWDPSTLSWSDFRNNLLGPTDPSDGPDGSIRKTILETYKELGLTSEPNKGDNGVHASASPFEGLAEKNNWLNVSFASDGFGKALIAAGLSEETIKEWSVDPRVEMEDGSKGSVFDALEDMDSGDCLAMLVKLNELNEDQI